MEFNHFKIIAHKTDAKQALDFALNRLYETKRIQEIVLIDPIFFEFSQEKTLEYLQSKLKILEESQVLIRVYLREKSVLSSVFRQFGIVYESKLNPKLVFKICQEN